MCGKKINMAYFSYLTSPGYRYRLCKCTYKPLLKGLSSVKLRKALTAFFCVFFFSFAGFDAVTVANNHFNDFGSEGANFTVETLKKAGIKYFGVSYGNYDSSQV